MFHKEKTAIAILRGGRSFHEAEDVTGIGYVRLQELVTKEGIKVTTLTDDSDKTSSKTG